MAIRVSQVEKAEAWESLMDIVGGKRPLLQAQRFSDRGAFSAGTDPEKLHAPCCDLAPAWLFSGSRSPD